MPSYYTPDLSPVSSFVVLEGEEFHHLSHVKRVGVGDMLKLNSGKGVIAAGRISELGKHSARIEVTSIDSIPLQTNKYAIAFTLLKNKHDELIVEKCTELGASKFYPMVSEFSVRNPSTNSDQRFERIALSAIKQCDNPYLPAINPTISVVKALANIISEGWMPVLCSERRPDVWLRDLKLEAPPCFLIGPEGGWAESEFAMFTANHVPEVIISNLIARAETAAITIAAQYVGLRY
jgi:16S rRNA (uracil1498-N3)-methyltransferase